MTVMAIRARRSSNRIQILEAFVIVIHQKGSRFFAIKDRFVKVHIIALDQEDM